MQRLARSYAGAYNKINPFVGAEAIRNKNKLLENSDD